MFDKLLHLSKSQVSAMSCLRSHDLREAISNLLAVSMHLQDTLSRFHRPGLHKVDVSTWRVRRPAPLRFTNPRAAELSVPSARIHQNSDKPCSASWRTRTRDTTCFQQNLDLNCNSGAAVTIFDVSSPISIGQHHDRNLRSDRNSRNNIKIATNEHVACRISNQISQQTLDVDFRVVAVPT